MGSYNPYAVPWWLARRSSGTRQDGGSFSEAEVQAVWNKARIDFAYNPATHRRDSCNAIIERARHGDTNHPYGWEIDHIIPVARGGADFLVNLQPLQWENNRAKSDGPLACVRP